MSPEFIAILSIGATLAGTQLAAVLWLAGYVQSQANAVRAEMRSEIGNVRTEIGGVRTEIGAVRTEVTDETRSVRTEITGVLAEISCVRGETADLRERMARVEGLLEGLRDTIGNQRDIG